MCHRFCTKERGIPGNMESANYTSDMFETYQPRGRYYRVDAAGERVVLTPVKVPAHVIEERKARIRKKQMERRVRYNRERAASMNVGFVAFMAVAIIICCVVCYFYISLQGEVTTRLRSMASLQNEIEQVTISNDMLEKRIGSQENISQIKQTAEEQLGMQHVSPEQIIYYSVNDQDYMLQYDKVQ